MLSMSSGAEEMKYGEENMKSAFMESMAGMTSYSGVRPTLPSKFH